MKSGIILEHHDAEGRDIFLKNHLIAGQLDGLFLAGVLPWGNGEAHCNFSTS